MNLQVTGIILLYVFVLAAFCTCVIQQDIETRFWAAIVGILFLGFAGAASLEYSASTANACHPPVAAVQR